MFEAKPIRLSKKWLGFTSLISLTITPAIAQTVPSSALPSHIERGPDAPESKQPAFMPPVVQTKPHLTPNREAAMHSFFVLGGVNIKGVTAYPIDQLTSFYASQLHHKVSVADIQDVAAAIGRKYRADGYILAKAYVPTQTLGKDGVITIMVDEGSINKVVFEGAQPQDTNRGLVETYARKIADMNPVKSDMLERYLLLINDLPGNSAHAILRPSGSGQSGTDLVIVYEHKTFQGSLSADNRNSRTLGPWQTTATLGENSLAGFDERTVVRGISTFNSSELQDVDVQHEEQLDSEGTKLLLFASHARTAPGSYLSVLDIRVNSDDVQAEITHPFLRSRESNFTTRAIFDIRNEITDILDTKLNADRVRSIRIGGEYDRADAFKGVNLFDLEVSHGIDGLGSTSAGAGRSTINGVQDYTKINFNLSRTQELPAGFSLFLASSGQASHDSLLLSEQFQIGGQFFGTAYDPGELSGDEGLDGKVELRYGQSVRQKYFESYQFYTYYDVGTVWVKDVQVGERKETSLASWGVGSRANFTPYLSGNIELAVPLTKTVASDPDVGSRIFGGLTVRF